MAARVRYTLDQLEVLVAIDRAGSFAGAARDLHRVPSAISYSVRTLEEALGIQLFDRRKQKAEMTAAGRRVLEEGSALLQQAAQLDALAVQIQTGWEPELQIVVDGLVPMGPITQALGVFRDEAIPTRIRLDVEYQEGVPDRWMADEADLMVILDFEDASDTLVRRELPPLEMCRVASPTHPLAQEESPDLVRLQSFMELVVRDSSPRYARNPKRPFGDARHLTYLSDFHSKRLALIEGAGFGWIPLHLIRSDLVDGSLVRLSTQETDSWTYRPELVHRKGVPLGRAGQRFMEVLLRNIENFDW